MYCYGISLILMMEIKDQLNLIICENDQYNQNQNLKIL